MKKSVAVVVSVAMFAVSTPAFAGCPYKKKTCPVSPAAKNAGYQTAESVRKRYKLNEKGTSQPNKVKVQTADEVLKQIEKNKKESEREQAAPLQKQQPAAPRAVRSRAAGRNSWEPKSSGRKKLQPVSVSPAAQEAMQGLAGQPQGYTIDVSKPAASADVSAE